ncbi:MAG: PorV/PorQ family protein [Candidatus Zhuqueibacterota bacterium]
MNKLVFNLIGYSGAVLVALAILAPPLSGQTDNTGTTGANYLKIGVDARSLGMAGAGVGMKGNALSIHWNPAISGFIANTELGFMHHRYVQSMAHEVAVFTSHISPEWTFALAFSYFNAGSLDKTERTAPGEFVQRGTFSASDFSPTISSAYRAFDRLSLGVSIKPIFESIDMYNGQTLSFDFGGLYAYRGFCLGLAVRNLGPGLALNEKAFNLPFIFSCGGSCQIQQYALVAAELEKPADNQLVAKVGVELSPVKLLALRGGYSFGPMNQELSRSAGLATGVGIRLQNFSLDYAFNPMGILGNSHRISLIYSFVKKAIPELHVRVKPTTISPDNDGVDDLCRFHIQTQNCQSIKRWELKILDSARNPVKTWKGSNGLPEELTWYGVSDSGGFVGAGMFEYVFSVYCGTDRSSLQERGIVTVAAAKKIAPVAQPAPLVIPEKKTFTLGDILFDVNRATIRPENEFLLNRVVEFLKNYPDASVIISGYTDDLATNEYNMQLSVARANAVKNYLLKYISFDPDKLQTQGFGETQPIAPNTTDENRQKNRRVEIVVLYNRAGNQVEKAAVDKFASPAQLQKIIDLVQLAALKYDVCYGAGGDRVKSMARLDAEQAEQAARAEAEKWGYGLIKAVVTGEVSLYELLSVNAELQESGVWKRFYSAWKGRLVELTELNAGQAVFILYFKSNAERR